MTENNDMAAFREEGENPFSPDSERDNSTDSPTEETTTDDDPSPEGEKENTQDDPDKDKPFHEHPRWKAREDEWNKRFNESEARHQEDIKKALESLGADRKENAEQTKIPSWFGGTQEQWDAYRQDRDAEIKAAEDRAIERLEGKKSSEEKAIQEATDYMNAEITFIETDKSINPDGLKVDPNLLLKTVMDNELIDTKGRWNYRAAFRILKGSIKPADPAPKTNEDRKKLASVTTDKDDNAEKKPVNYKTTADFKKNKPW